MKVLVTGAGGFVGRHLCPVLRAAENDVEEASGPEAKEGELRFEVTDPANVTAVFEATRPDAVVHLAAVSSVAFSHRQVARTFAVNTLGTTHLLDAARRVCPDARLLLIGSAEVYGRGAAVSPTHEGAAIEPLSPYAASKAGAEVAALQFHRSYGTDAVCVRPFSHLGAGQGPQFVVPSFARQIAAIKAGTGPAVIRTGDLSPIRDFLHVDDVIAAYELLLRSGAPGVPYNVASGRGRSIRSLLEEMLELSGVTARVEVDADLVRPAEIPVLVGDSNRLRALGWAPKKDVRTALRDILSEHGAI